MRLPTREELRYHGSRWAWVVGLATLAYVVFPSSATNVELLAVGTPAERDVIAPFTFPVNKSDQERVREAEELASSVKPIYQYQERALDSAKIAMHAFFSSAETAADQGGAMAILQVVKAQGFALGAPEAAYLAKGGKRHALEKALSKVLDRTLALGITGPGVLQVEQAPELIVRRRSGEQSVPRGGATSRSLGGVLGPILRDSLIFAIFWVLLVFYRRETYRERRQVALIGALFALVLLEAAVVARFVPSHPEIIFLPFMAMLLTVLFNGRVSMIAAMILAIVIGMQPVFHDIPALFLCVIGGVTAALTVRVLRRRSNFYVPVLIIALGYLAGAVALGLAGSWTVA